MGKATKAHRAKVEKRNRRISQEKYAMQNALNKMMKQMAEQQSTEETEKQLTVKVGDKEMPFSVVEENEIDSIVSFKENNPEIVNIGEPEYDSAGFSIEDREIDIDTNILGEFKEVKTEVEEEE